MADAILVINAGSSSIKFCVYTVDQDRLARLWRGQVERINTAPHFIARNDGGEVITDERWPVPPGEGGHRLALEHMGRWLTQQLQHVDLLAVGHRVVHGGVDLRAPTLIDAETIEKLESLVPLAPLHQPHNLAAIEAVRLAYPGLPQVACFDTAFHRGHPEVADRYGLPNEMYEDGIRRFGFHGLSYEYIADALRDVAGPEIAEGRVVVAHLGNGASMCALHKGRSMDSTLGFSALDGLPMGTRCGSLDPGVIIHLLRRSMSLDDLENLLYRKSGLLGVSGTSNDMRRLLESDDPRAANAVEYFVYRIARELGGLMAVLGGLDAVVFTAGIGANSPEIRERVCNRCGWLGINLDPEANRRGGPRITAADSPVSVWALRTDEERMIAVHTIRVLHQHADSSLQAGPRYDGATSIKAPGEMGGH